LVDAESSGSPADNSHARQTATLLSSHAGGPRAATGDKTFVSQTKRADTVVKSQPAASPKDLPVGSDVTAQTTITMTVTVVGSGSILTIASATTR
jgi:capsid protein